MCRQAATVWLVKTPSSAGCSGLSSAERLVRLPDPRQRRGVRGGAADRCVRRGGGRAVVHGDRAVGPQRAAADTARRTPADLAERADRVAQLDAPEDRLHRLPGRSGRPDRRVPTGAESVAADGKSARGSRHGQTPAAHLLAAMTSDGRTVTSYAYGTGRMKSPASPPFLPPSTSPGSWCPPTPCTRNVTTLSSSSR